MHVNVYTHAYALMCACIYRCMHIPTNVYMHKTYTHMLVYTHSHTNIYAYIYMQTYTYTHISTTPCSALEMLLSTITVQPIVHKIFSVSLKSQR